jgi:hypothetical protein
MNADQRQLAVQCSMLLSERITGIRRELEQDPAFERSGVDPMIMGIVMVLCNAVTYEPTWEQRHRLFEAYSGCKWPDPVLVRERIDEVLNGLNLRSDYWRSN